MKRKINADSNLFTYNGIKRVDSAASKAEMASKRRVGRRSARLSKAEVKAPTTKPVCTDIVSQARPASLNPQAEESAGTTAEAENQTAFANSTARDNRIRVRHLDCFIRKPRASP